MCDTVVKVGPDGVLFAKNSDRDANEAQVLHWVPARTHRADSVVVCTYLTIPQVPRTHAVLLSRPFWMWGAEMGTNEHGVTIGNEAVFTDQPYADTGLTGMDLLRLALERASTAAEAVDVIVNLLEEHGQGGGCGFEKRGFTYHNSFIVADPTTAFVLETAGRLWAVEEVSSGVRSISNGLTIPGFAEEHRDQLRSRVSGCDVRSARTASLAAEAGEAADLAAVLRSHGSATWPRYDLLTGTLGMPCMHGGGLIAGSVTVAGWISELRPGGSRHWATATACPCLSLFKPVAVDTPVHLGLPPVGTFDDGALWWRQERLNRMVMSDPARLAVHLEERNEVERGWFADPPPTVDAFAEADRLLDRWTAALPVGAGHGDTRPWWMRRYWEKRSRAAGMPSVPGR
ncbi:MAG TPA: peptidase U34 [Acidimicrobiales bacterium]|nr:peptidase U34 [Acidimicrobiales bacterium]